MSSSRTSKTKSTPPEGKDLSHRWGGPSMIHLTEKDAKIADFRGSVRVPAETKIDVLDVYCQDCRRDYADAADQVCQAKIDNQHLIGGDQSERVKRKRNPLPPGAVVVPGPRINRYGIGAVVRREI